MSDENKSERRSNYQTAANLYASSLRAFEQRSSSFLILNSIVMGGFVIMLRYFQQDASAFDAFLPTLGIAVGGFSISLTYLRYHKTTSKDISYWRAYMRLLEHEDNEIKNDLLRRPWELMLSYAKEYDKGSYYNALQRYPGPLLWLFLPTIFTTAWFIGLFWVISLNTKILEGHFWIFAGITVIIAGVGTYYYWKKSSVDDTFDKLRETYTSIKDRRSKR